MRGWGVPEKGGSPKGVNGNPNDIALFLFVGLSTFLSMSPFPALGTPVTQAHPQSLNWGPPLPRGRPGSLWGAGGQMPAVPVVWWEMSGTHWGLAET